MGTPNGRACVPGSIDALGNMALIPHGLIGRAVAVVWLALCVAVLVFGFVQREIHDMPIALVWFLVFLSFPLGAGAIVVLGIVLGSSGIHYMPFWSELPLWLVAVLVGYWQWFILVPALVRKISGGRSHVPNRLHRNPVSSRSWPP